MTDKKTISRDVAEHRRFWIVGLFFRWLKRSLFDGAAAFVINTDVAEANIFDLIAWNAADDRGVSRLGVVSDDVADNDPADLTFGHCFVRTTIALAEANKDRRI